MWFIGFRTDVAGSLYIQEWTGKWFGIDELVLCYFILKLLWLCNKCNKNYVINVILRKIVFYIDGHYFFILSHLTRAFTDCDSGTIFAITQRDM